VVYDSGMMRPAVMQLRRQERLAGYPQVGGDGEEALTAEVRTMHQRIFRGCRRSLCMWREATGKYQSLENEEAERVKLRRLKKLTARRFAKPS
jgi:hypothetical protein